MKIAKFEKVKVWTVLQQIKKIWEEVIELMKECMIMNRQGIMTESFDVVQAVFTLLFVAGCTKEEVESHLRLHYQKLEIRDYEGKIQIEEWIEV